MNAGLALRVLAKDLRLGPRSPIFLWAVVFPVVGTLVVQLVFGSLFAPRPRMGVVDLGSSQITVALGEIEGIELTLVSSADELTRLVRDHNLDAGLVLPAGFDEQVRAGERPLLELFVSGESLASNRLILAVTTLDLVRAVEGSPAPVEVDVVALGDPLLPMAARLTPLLVLFALLIAGVFVPAFSLVQERENGTLAALLVTPVRATDVLAAKAVLGFVLAFLMALVTLALNGALGNQPVALLLAVAAGAVMLSLLGLIYGSASPDAKTLFTLMKSLNIILFAPVIFYVFPDWPQWIAQLFPTYWVINPIFEVAIRDAGLAEVAGQLVVGLAISALLVPVIVLLARRMAARVAAG
ncbi:MAG TPA: ABC transporter permease [Patescibacteria group bacterium]|nr:ABC transporter permease [Patescibacteria group bacterium]